MKKITLILLLLISTGLQASHLRKLVTAGASAIAASPFLYTAYNWHAKKQHLNAWSKELENVDPLVEKAARDHLQKRGYASAAVIPMKVYEDDHGMEAVCDSMIGFSYQYEDKIKNALINPEEHNSRKTLSTFRHDLDHEMFHIGDQHAKKSTAANIWIPGLVEAGALPFTYKLLKTKNSKLFALGLLASIPIKWGATRLLNLLHRRDQEYRAEVAAIKKNYDLNDLYNTGLFRKEILEKGMGIRLGEYFMGDTSQSKALPVLMKIFSEKIDFDLERAKYDEEYSKKQALKILEIYNKLHAQPYHWPLRVMSLEQDSDHPFTLDIVKEFDKRIKEVQNLN